MQRILVLGIDGLLGSTFSERISQQEGFELITTARHVSADYNFNYTPTALSKLLLQTKPDIVINCIAVSSQKTRIFKALLVNSLLPIQLALYGYRHKFNVIHFSTNAVFSGRKRSNTERTLPNPGTRYGFTKLIGDFSSFRNRIIRTSFIGVSPNTSVKSGFIEKLKNTKPNGSISIIDNYTWNGLTSEALVEVVLGLIRKNDLSRGIFHLGTLSSLTREQLVHNILVLLDRNDVQVNVLTQNLQRNLSLNTIKSTLVSSWWSNTRYGEIPELSDLLRDMNIY
jgi:dTDP-4-dehydrorhamnose reductase